MLARIGGRFTRVEPRRRVRAFLLALMAGSLAMVDLAATTPRS
jgi:hypothetical protein